MYVTETCYNFRTRAETERWLCAIFYSTSTARKAWSAKIPAARSVDYPSSYDSIL